MSHQHAEVDWAAQLTRLELGAELHLPIFEQAAAWFRELHGRTQPTRILDVGSGAGVVTTVLAHAYPEAETVAVDGTQALLEAVMSRAQREGVANRVRVLHAELPQDANTLPEADLIWSSDAVHHVGDQQAAIDMLHAHLRKGGLLAVCEGGLPARFLPNEIGFGRPGLQPRLDVAAAEGFAGMRASLANATPAIDDWPGMLRASGLESVASRTFLVDAPAPLSARGRAYLRTQLVAERHGLADRLDPTDLHTIDRLIDDDDRTGLMRRPDVFFLVARTVHVGRAV